MEPTFVISKATRQGVNPLVVLYAESGCGKTFSALLLARGMAGVNGKIVVGDSESGRGSLYADVIPGGYETFDLASPFSPERYIDAIDAIEASGAAVGIIDSGSHEWEGIGGVLDMAGDNEAKSGKAGLHNWKTPKLEHAKFVQRLLRTRIPFIICLRAKHKTRQVRNNGRTEIVKDDFTSPIQADDFIFEATCHMEILPDHTIRLTKWSHPDLQGCFPEDGKAPLSIKHGEAIAQWAKGGNGSKPQVQQVQQGQDTKALKAKLWAMAKPHYADAKEFEQTLWDNAMIDPDSETLSTLTTDRLVALTKQLESYFAKKEANV